MIFLVFEEGKFFDFSGNFKLVLGSWNVATSPEMWPRVLKRRPKISRTYFKHVSKICEREDQPLEILLPPGCGFFLICGSFVEPLWDLCGGQLGSIDWICSRVGPVGAFGPVQFSFYLGLGPLYFNQTFQ